MCHQIDVFSRTEELKKREKRETVSRNPEFVFVPCRILCKSLDDEAEPCSMTGRLMSVGVVSPEWIHVGYHNTIL